jgi:hypothetical protein
MTVPLSMQRMRGQGQCWPHQPQALCACEGLGRVTSVTLVASAQQEKPLTTHREPTQGGGQLGFECGLPLFRVSDSVLMPF